ncbi:MAG: hypothetical protein J6K39_00995 [Clostridia bacterium]|nr:hypothetical protein [Clostridia bacterium]
MKKIIPIFLCVCFCFLLVGCENETKINAAHISDITGAQSTNYAIKVTLDEDDRVVDKYVGMQIKSSVDDLILTFGEELKDTYALSLPKKDYWYNLTYLISKTNGVGTEAGYLNYEEYGNRVFRFSADTDVNVTFRMVVGKTKKNEETGEEILVLGEEISDEVTVNMKKREE